MCTDSYVATTRQGYLPFHESRNGRIFFDSTFTPAFVFDTFCFCRRRYIKITLTPCFWLNIHDSRCLSNIAKKQTNQTHSYNSFFRSTSFLLSNVKSTTQGVKSTEILPNIGTVPAIPILSFLFTITSKFFTR